MAKVKGIPQSEKLNVGKLCQYCWYDNPTALEDVPKVVRRLYIDWRGKEFGTDINAIEQKRLDRWSKTVQSGHPDA